MTLPEIIYDLRTIISSGHLSDDSNFSNRLLIHWVNTQRALWLTNEYNKVRDKGNNEVQVLKNIAFAAVDSTEVAGFSLDTAYLRSVNQIPRTLKLHIGDTLILRPLDVFAYSMNYVDREQATYSGNGKFNRNMLFVFKHNDYLYLKYGTQLEYATIPKKLRGEGAFENPLEVDDFNGTYDSIFHGTTQYPISARFIDYIKAEILKLDVKSLFSSPKDIANDDSAGV